jgi:hypothetical protein
MLLENKVAVVTARAVRSAVPWPGPLPERGETRSLPEFRRLIC